MTERTENTRVGDQAHNSDAEPLLSILSLTYNQARYIRQAIDSFLAQQTNFKVEILIHDDASTDGTADIIREYQRQYPGLIRPILREENRYRKDKGFGGIFKALNDSARGKYVAFCEGDDYWIDPHKLQKQVDYLEDNPDYGMVHTDNMCLEESTGKLFPSHKALYCPHPPSGEVFYKLIKMDFITTLTVVCRREILARALVSMFKWLDQEYHRDFSTWLEISRLSKVQYLQDVTAVYRANAGSVSRQQNDRRHASFLRQGLEIILAFAGHYKLDPAKRQECIDRYFNYHMATALIHKDVFGDFRAEVQSYQPRGLKKKIMRFLYLRGINVKPVELVYRPVIDRLRRLKKAVPPR